MGVLLDREGAYENKVCMSSRSCKNACVMLSVDVLTVEVSRCQFIECDQVNRGNGFWYGSENN